MEDVEHIRATTCTVEKRRIAREIIATHYGDLEVNLRENGKMVKE